MTHWFEKYIGIPFQAMGRGMDGVDCAGLCILILRQERGITVWDVAESYTVGEMHRRDGLARLDGLLRRQLSVWQPVSLSDLRPFDVVLYRVHGAETHCAMAVDRRRVLHVEERHPVHMARLHLPGYQLSGVFRHA